MRVGTFARDNRELEDAVRENADFVDIRLGIDRSGLVLADAKKTLAEHGISSSLHTPSEQNWRGADISRMVLPYVDLGREMDAEFVTMHTTLSSLFYTDEEIHAFLDNVPLVYDAAREVGVVLSVESFGFNHAELALLFNACPEMRLTLDIGHEQLVASRNRAIDLIQVFHDRIVQVNVHDNRGQDALNEVLETRKRRTVSVEEVREIARKYDLHLPIGEGTIRFNELFSALRCTGYDGRFLMLCSDRSRFNDERRKFVRLWSEAC
ncbi:MAG: sugar phosphate isomerase/epimerase [Candidatus Thorarchaeota archaeon]